MRFSTDDGLFGFIVTPMTNSGLFRFQIIVDGKLVGDAEPCYLESAMRSLGKLNRLEDDRLSRISFDRSGVLAAIDSDEVLHDGALLQIAESLDGWKVRGYRYQEDVIFLTQEYLPGQNSRKGAISSSVVPFPEYSAIFSVTRKYWMEVRINGES